jgi:hypothetical protein
VSFSAVQCCNIATFRNTFGSIQTGKHKQIEKYWNIKYSFQIYLMPDVLEELPDTDHNLAVERDKNSQ